MSSQLNAMGVIGHFATEMGSRLTAARLGWQAVLVILNGVYFLLHYMFAAQARSPCSPGLSAEAWRTSIWTTCKGEDRQEVVLLDHSACP
jgi:hypothetical protein